MTKNAIPAPKSGDVEKDSDGKIRVAYGDRSFAADMNFSSKMFTLDRSIVVAPLGPTVASPSGYASIGMIASIADTGASDPALAQCLPDWTATQDMSVHLAQWLSEGPAVVDCNMIRLGKKVVIVGVNVYDGQGTFDHDVLLARIEAGELTLAGTSLVTFARLPGSAAVGAENHRPADVIGKVRSQPDFMPPTGTMYERMGARLVDPPNGVIELDRAVYVANSIGTILGGAQATMMEMAAEAMRPGMYATDLEMHFLSQIKAGPARTRCSVVRDSGDHSVIAVELVDVGHNDQLLTLATVTLQRLPSCSGHG